MSRIKFIPFLALLFVAACGEQAPPDAAEAPAEHVRYWAEQGAPISQLQLAEMYEQGFQIEQDHRQAAFWFRRAARSGQVMAQERLAQALALGQLGLAPDHERAAFWWQQAAMSGSSRTLVDWAYVHFYGDDGYPRDCRLAVKLLNGPSRGSENNELLNALAWILSTCPDPVGRDGQRAIQIMQTVMDNYGSYDPAYVDTLAAAYAESGQFEKAVEKQLQAVELLGDEAPEFLLEEFQARLALYREGHAYREAGRGTDLPSDILMDQLADPGKAKKVDEASNPQEVGESEAAEAKPAKGGP